MFVGVLCLLGVRLFDTMGFRFVELVACVFGGVCFARVHRVIVLVGYFGFAGVLMLECLIVGICLTSVWFGNLVLY